MLITETVEHGAELLLLFPELKINLLDAGGTAATLGVLSFPTICEHAESRPDIQWQFIIDTCRRPLDASEEIICAPDAESNVTFRSPTACDSPKRSSSTRNWTSLFSVPLSGRVAEFPQLKGGLLIDAMIHILRSGVRLGRMTILDRDFLDAMQHQMNYMSKKLGAKFSQCIEIDLPLKPFPLHVLHKGFARLLISVRKAWWRTNWLKLMAFLLATCFLIFFFLRCALRFQPPQPPQLPQPQKPCLESDPQGKPTPQPDVRKQPDKVSKTTISEVVPADIYDGNKKTAKIETHFLAIEGDGYNWVRNSHLKFQKASGDEIKSNDLKQQWRNYNVTNRWGTSNMIIAVGVASYEGSILRQQEWLACKRAKLLREWLNDVGIKKDILQSLTLGKNMDAPNSTNASNKQRPLLLIRVLEKDEGINLEEALQLHLPKLSKWQIKIPSYSLGGESKFKLVSDMGCKKEK